MAREQAVKSLRGACRVIQGWAAKKEKLIKRPEWGNVNFEDIRNEIETAFRLAEEIVRLPIQMVDDGAVWEMEREFSGIGERFKRIDEYEMERDEEVRDREKIASGVRFGVRNVANCLAPWVWILVYREGVETPEYLRKIRIEAEGEERKIKGIVEAARAAAGEAGAAEFTEEFRKEGEKAKWRSMGWLVATVFLGVLGVWFSIDLMGRASDVPRNVWEAVYVVGGRAFVLSVFFYSVVWSGRVTLANMNLEAANKHRAVSLQTLKAFAAATNDAGVKDAVVLEAARAAFENTPNGFIRRDGADNGARLRALEVVTSVKRVGGGVSE